MVIGWAYIKELAATNTREKGIGFIKLYMRRRHSKGGRKESVSRQSIKEKCDQCSSFLTLWRFRKL